MILFVFPYFGFSKINVKNLLENVSIFNSFYSIPFRRNKTLKMEASGNLLCCCKRSIYQDIVVKTEETSTYQELDLSDSAYQNTTLR